MNRRGFLSGLIAACVAPQILMRAAPEGFKWSAKRELLLPANPDMPFNARVFAGKWNFIAHDKFYVDFMSAIKPERPELAECMFLSMIRPLSNCVLLRILPPETESSGGITIPQHTLSPEEVQERNHKPEPPPPEVGIVEAIGPWRQLDNGMKVPPPFPPGSKVLVREGSGQKLNRDVGERLKLVHMDDVLAVIG